MNGEWRLTVDFSTRRKTKIKIAVKKRLLRSDSTYNFNKTFGCSRLLKIELKGLNSQKHTSLSWLLSAFSATPFALRVSFGHVVFGNQTLKFLLVCYFTTKYVFFRILLLFLAMKL